MSTKAIFDNIAEHLEEQIDLAENKIVVAVAWFTNKRLFDALCIKAADGVEVKLIISDNEINRNSNIDFGDIQIGKSKLYLLDIRLSMSKYIFSNINSLFSFIAKKWDRFTQKVITKLLQFGTEN